MVLFYLFINNYVVLKEIRYLTKEQSSKNEYFVEK